MAILNRKQLKKLFQKGSKPQQTDFESLIDSVWNKADEALRYDENKGLQLQSSLNSSKLISFYGYQHINNAEWTMDWKPNGLQFNYGSDTILHFDPQKRLGVGHEDPKEVLDVNGYTRAKGRVNSLYEGKVPADGKWHSIVKGLDGCHILEVCAGTGKKLSGKYAMCHAIATASYGSRRNKINITQAVYGSRLNRLKLRWKGSTYNYDLQVRSALAYDPGVLIQYQVGSLWKDHLMEGSWK